MPVAGTIAAVGAAAVGVQSRSVKIMQSVQKKAPTLAEEAEGISVTPYRRIIKIGAGIATPTGWRLAT